MAPVGASTSTLRTDNITSQTGTATLAISNVATINGAAYPPSGTILTGIIPYTQMLTVVWGNIGSFGAYYADFPLTGVTLTNESIVLTTMINDKFNNPDIDKAENCWIINVTPNADGFGTLRVFCAANPTTVTAGQIRIAWVVTQL
jgi:hypothetical protein